MPDTTPPSTAPPLDEPAQRQAYIATLQRDLNRFLSALGAPAPLAVDGEWDAATETAFIDVCRVLGIEPERTVRAFRIISGAAAEPTDQERRRRETEGAEYAAQLKARFAAQRNGNPVTLEPDQVKRAAKKLFDQELAECEKKPASVKLGVMIEIPSILWQLEALMQHISSAAAAISMINLMARSSLNSQRPR